MFIGRSKQEMRQLHWREIEKRVTTHEGELLKGTKGKEYKQKYSKQYLGKDLSRPLNYDQRQFQEELAKAK